MGRDSRLLHAIWIALALTLAAACTAAAIAAVPAGGEIAVNVTTEGQQEDAAVAMDADGDFVVAWEGPDASGTGVFARRVSAAGQAQGLADIGVSTTTAGAQEAPAVAMDADGDFVVAWEGPDASGDGVFARCYDAAGTPLTAEIPVNSTTAGAQGAPAVAIGSEGGFVVAWRGTDAGGEGIFARLFDAACAARGGEIPVNAATDGAQVNPSAAMDRDGDFVVTWESLSGDPSDPTDEDVFARRFDAGGGAQGDELQVNGPSDATRTDSSPSVAMDASGAFAVAWSREDAVNLEQLGIFAQRFDAAGIAQGGEIPVSTASSALGSPAVAMDADGDFVVAWDPFEVVARRFSAAGAPLTDLLSVNTTVAFDQRGPAVASAAGGDFVVAWDGNGAPLGSDAEDHDGIYARLFDAPEEGAAGGGARDGAGGAGGGGLQTGGAAVLDRTAPLALLFGNRRQRGRGSVSVTVVCRTEACTAVATGTVKPPGARRFKLGRATRQIPRGGRAKLTLKVPKKARKAIKRALRKRRKVSAKLRIAVTDAAGNKRKLRRDVRFRR